MRLDNNRKPKNKRYKHILISIFILLTSTIYFFAAYLGYKHQNINLSDFSNHIGIVENTGETYRIGSKGRRSLVFFVDLSGLNQRLGIYRMCENYEDLHKSIKYGDEISIFYESHKSKENVNIDIIQIEEKGRIIYSKEEYEKKESALIWIGLIAGFLSVIYSWIYFRKNVR
ncbi:MAG: hypothetical protein JZU53_05475 [Paludibacter sp.]|nr:hypothetical protein [Paludibacter sp.]